MTALQLVGSAAFGAIIGWFLYYINRHRRADVSMTDLVTLIGAIGGAAVLAIFKPGSDLFGAYGIGLFLGFFAYFVVLIVLVRMSDNFTLDYFLDGRRKRPQDPFYIPDDGKPDTPLEVVRRVTTNSGQKQPVPDAPLEAPKRKP